jgi:flagella basal body P-ring formation protein FlgA
MMLFCKILTLCALASACAAEPVSVSVIFRDSATVNDTVIRLNDIAVIHSTASNDRLESLRNAVVGEAAPAGYSRKVNTEEVFTCVLKKKFNGLQFDRVQKKAIQVATESREKKVGDFEQEIQKFFSDSVKWQPGEYTVVVRNIDEKWKCLNKPLSVSLCGLQTKYPKGNVNCRLIARQNSKTYSIPVVCLVTVVTPVVVAKTAIPRGSLLTSENCSLEKRDITHFACNPFTGLSQLDGMIANRTIQNEAIVHEKLTARMPIIGKDEQVYVIVDRGVVRVSIVMRARQQGALGEKIWVENELTHKLLKTKIIGKGKVELLEGVKTI